MPKMKNHSGASKRFKKTGNGQLKRRHGYTSHLFRNKTKKQKRRLSDDAIMHKTDHQRISTLLPYKKRK
ncbi:50S ribosomal protein L35 [Salibacterium halotolerans]|uniref:Large ribosomal subunit protein bL35 n=1 Tax=Salibacterium halotolerans TaxID=1884432 RepID=A0A1I5SLP8_9BACI|nr:50S ribosomal protein L35 [Salibacterium halotolerans]SFP71653.1 large subunit ribosomal protein L35 [Salibacterium halotolerans]